MFEFITVFNLCKSKWRFKLSSIFLQNTTYNTKDPNQLLDLNQFIENFKAYFFSNLRIEGCLDETSEGKSKATFWHLIDVTCSSSVHEYVETACCLRKATIANYCRPCVIVCRRCYSSFCICLKVSKALRPIRFI